WGDCADISRGTGEGRRACYPSRVRSNPDMEAGARPNHCFDRSPRSHSAVVYLATLGDGGRCPGHSVKDTTTDRWRAHKLWVVRSATSEIVDLDQCPP